MEREGELAAIAGAFDRLARDEGQVFVIEGEPGIGKTRLLAEAHELAAAAGVRTLSATGSEIETGFALGVVRQLLDPAVRTASPAERTALFEGAAALSGSLFGFWPEVAGEAASPEAPQLLYGLYWLLANLAEQPLLLTIDDAHWADPPSLQWLVFLARRVEGLRVLVLVAARPSESHDLAELTGQATTSVLSPSTLSQSAVAEIVGRALGRPGAPEFVAACAEVSGGNPFYLTELLHALRAEGVEAAVAQAEHVRAVGPAGVSKALFLRLARLGPDPVGLARAVAVLGGSVEPRHAAAVAQLGRESASSAADSLIRADLFADAGTLRFSHPIIRTTIYADLVSSERSRLHGRAADVLAADGAHAERVASHLLLADPAGAESAFRLLRDAGQCALNRGDPVAAVRYLARGLSEPPPKDERAELLLALGIAELRAGAGDAIEHLKRAHSSIVDPRRRAAAARELGFALVAAGDPESAAELLEASIADVGEADRELALRLEAELAAHARMNGTGAGARLERHAAVLGDTPAERVVLANLSQHLASSGRPAAEAVDVATRALKGDLLLAEEGSHSPSVYFPIFVLVCADHFAEAERVLGLAVDDAGRCGSVLGFAIASAVRAQSLLRRGAIREAEADARASVDAMRLQGWPLALPSALAHLVDALLEQGDAEGAQRELELSQLPEELPDTWMFLAVLGSRARLRLAAGDAAGAHADLAELSRRDQRWGASTTAGTTYRSWAAPVLASLGRTDEARDLADEELVLARTWGTRRAIGMALRAVGIASGGESGVERLREAVTELEHSSAELEHARACVDLGSALRRGKQRVEARDHLRAGLDLAHRCGATLLAERALVELRIAGARPRREALSGSDALTASERRVAEMAAGGMTNRQVAQALFVTPKTVAFHLTHVYQKLTIESREELARALAL